MLFGQSVFQSVLTRLDEQQKDEDEEGAAPGAGFRIHGLGSGFVAPSVDHVGAAAAQADAYLAYLPDEPADPQEPEGVTGAQEPARENPIPPHLLRLTQNEIADELAITAQDTETSLNEKRRSFAKRNHPDGVAPEWRDNATVRMTIANLLIDAAMKNLVRR